MKNWQTWLLFIIFVPTCLLSQELNLDQAIQITNSQGDNLHPAWSPDGLFIAFQTNRNGNWDILGYSLENDSVFTVIQDKNNSQHPVWYPDGKRLVFDSDTLGIDYLYSYSFGKQEVTPLFTRKIICKEASFPPVPRQVYFTGFDLITEHWQIYSFDFIYDNLNLLTHYQVDCADPQVAPNGKNVVFSKAASVFEPNSWPLINWYGEELTRFDSLSASQFCWDPGGLKIYFISTMDNKEGELYSIWKNGTHLQRLTHDSLSISYPAISPDGKRLAVVVNTTKGNQLFLVDLDDF